MLSVALGAIGLGAVLCFHHPSLLTTSWTLFSTYDQPEGRWPAAYGLAGGARVPEGYLRQLLLPLRRTP